MGFWNDGIRPRSRSRSSSPSRSQQRSHSKTSRTHSQSHSQSQPKHRPSTTGRSSSFFSSTSRSRALSPGRSRSYTSASPRSGFVAKIRRFLRQLYEKMRRHPFRVFFLVVMPLITGGALTKLLSVVGVRLPRSVENMVGSSMDRGYGQGDRFFAKGGARDFGGGSALSGMGMGMGGGVGQGIQGALTLAKMFM